MGNGQQTTDGEGRQKQLGSIEEMQKVLYAAEKSGTNVNGDSTGATGVDEAQRKILEIMLTSEMYRTFDDIRSNKGTRIEDGVSTVEGRPSTVDRVRRTEDRGQIIEDRVPSTADIEQGTEYRVQDTIKLAQKQTQKVCPYCQEDLKLENIVGIAPDSRTGANLIHHHDCIVELRESKGSNYGALLKMSYDQYLGNANNSTSLLASSTYFDVRYNPYSEESPKRKMVLQVSEMLNHLDVKYKNIEHGFISGLKVLGTTLLASLTSVTCIYGGETGLGIFAGSGVLVAGLMMTYSGAVVRKDKQDAKIEKDIREFINEKYPDRELCDTLLRGLVQDYKKYRYAVDQYLHDVHEASYKKHRFSILVSNYETLIGLDNGQQTTDDGQRTTDKRRLERREGLEKC